MKRDRWLLWTRCVVAGAALLLVVGCRVDDRERLASLIDELIIDETPAGELSFADAERLVTAPAFPTDALREGHVGRVHHVVDGDTLDLRVGEHTFKIRFKGASAPECHKDDALVGGVSRLKCNADDEFYGLASYQELLRIIDDKPLIVECEQSEQGGACEADVHGRWLANLVVVQGPDVGEELLRRGAGWTSTSFRSNNRARYCLAEYEAREQQRGMWAGRSVEETLALMNEGTQRWYRSHDARCDTAIRDL